MGAWHPFRPFRRSARFEETDVKKSKLRSLTPPLLLPNGREFKTWEQPLKFSHTYYVDGRCAKACDDNPGTKARPFKTISRAAELLRPGERVVVASGVYRECVRPARGGTGPRAMISYQAAPGAKVVIKGSQILEENWTRSRRKSPGKSAKVWAAPLPGKYFDGYNPFRVANVMPEQFDIMPWAQRLRGTKPYTLPRGLVFRNGRRLVQVHNYGDLAERDGTYWVTPKGTKVYVHSPAGRDPNKDTIEITTLGSIFVPKKPGLGYIHVKGFVVEHAGNTFPFPQWGAISTCRGHHWLIEENTVRHANGAGIDIGRQWSGLPRPTAVGRQIVRRNTVTDCGVCGIAGLALADSLVEDNVILRNAFHDVEIYYETAGIKTHHNRSSVIRRNLIADTIHGAGIWMDFMNVNSRCTRNILLRNTTAIFGAIFIEASSRLNLIDHNVIIGTQGAGIYEQDSRGQIFAHNFIAKSTRPAVVLRNKVTGRKVHKRPIIGGEHRVLNNVLIENGGTIEEHGPKSTLRSNVTAGVAKFNAKMLILTWHAQGSVPACEPVKTITHDFSLEPRKRGAVCPGPFGAVPKKPATVKLWPPAR